MSAPHTKTSATRIRGHTLLCLQGFRGEGYSPEFIANMKAIHQKLLQNPDLMIEPIVEPDIFCQACPHFKGGCTLRGTQSESEMRSQDQNVLNRLQLKAYELVPWSTVLTRIAQYVTGKDLTQICGKCPWLPLGYCSTGIDQIPKPVSR